MLDRMMAWYTGAARGLAIDHFTITDTGRRNLPKFSGTRTLEAINSFITALEREFRVRNAELQREPVDGVERTEGWATYAILQLEDAAAIWAKHTFPVAGPATTWEMFLSKLRSTYEPADAVFQLRAKWQTLRIGR